MPIRRRLNSTAAATAARYTGQIATVTVEIRGSSDPAFRPGQLLVVYDAGDIDVVPASQVVALQSDGVRSARGTIVAAL
jgi:hypothetical protein